MNKELNNNTFLSLVKLGIGNSEIPAMPDSIDWPTMKALAQRQGLSAIIFDALTKLSDNGLLTDARKIDQQLLRQWVGVVLFSHEKRYQDYRTRIGQLAGFINSHGYRMMVLKGYGLSLNYPNPSHRPSGDIDIWCFGQQKEVDDTIHKELGIEIDKSHHHHTVFHFNVYSVENHFDWVNIYAHKSSEEIEKIFKELAMDDSCWTEIDGNRVYLPIPNLHALFLLRHTLSDFASTRMSIRQMLDWAFFAKAHTNEIDWAWLQDVLKKFHMYDFFVCECDICTRYFGFDGSIFPPLKADTKTSDRIISDMLYPVFTEAQPKELIPRILFKYRRWRANAWKNKLCYPESSFYTFWRQVWSHLLKPASI